MALHLINQIQTQTATDAEIATSTMMHYLKTTNPIENLTAYNMSYMQDNLTSHINESTIAIRNVNEGISMMQIAEQALNKIIKHIQDIRDIALQSLNNLIPESQHESMQKKVSQLVLDINKIVQITEFNGQSLFKSGTDKFLSSLLTNNQNTADPTLNVPLFEGTALSDYLNMLHSIRITDLNVQKNPTIAMLDSNNNPYKIIQDLEKTLTSLRSEHARFGTIQKRFENSLTELQSYSDHLNAYRSKIKDSKLAEENAHLTYDQILKHFSSAILAQANNTQRDVSHLLSSY